MYLWYHHYLNVSHDGSGLIEVDLKCFFLLLVCYLLQFLSSQLQTLMFCRDLENMIGPRSERPHDIKSPCDPSLLPQVLWCPASTPGTQSACAPELVRPTPAAALSWAHTTVLSPAVLHLCSTLQLCFQLRFCSTLLVPPAPKFQTGMSAEELRLLPVLCPEVVRVRVSVQSWNSKREYETELYAKLS